jgi:ribosomal protein S13
MDNLDILNKVNITFVAKWDHINGDAYLIRNKETGKVITFGSKKDYKGITPNLRNKIIRNLGFQDKTESNNLNNIKIRTIKKYVNFKTIRTNKILYGYNVQAVMHLENIETGEEIWRRGPAKYVVDKSDILASFNEAVEKAKTKSTYDMWELKSWYFEYYVPIEDDPEQIILSNKKIKEFEDMPKFNRSDLK